MKVSYVKDTKMVQSRVESDTCHFNGMTADNEYSRGQQSWCWIWVGGGDNQFLIAAQRLPPPLIIIQSVYKLFQSN